LKTSHERQNFRRQLQQPTGRFGGKNRSPKKAVNPGNEKGVGLHREKMTGWNGNNEAGVSLNPSEFLRFAATA